MTEIKVRIAAFSNVERFIAEIVFKHSLVWKIFKTSRYILWLVRWRF